MNKSRMEAFSDGVIAIIITIMVLELKVPHGATLGKLARINADIFVLCVEFYLHRYLLEQSSSYVADCV